MDYVALGIDFHSIRNKNEERVINLLPEVLAEAQRLGVTKLGMVGNEQFVK